MAQGWEHGSNDPEDFKIRDPQVLALKEETDRIFDRKGRKPRSKRVKGGIKRKRRNYGRGPIDLEKNK